MAVTDLNSVDEATSADDIKAYAEQVAKEVEQERAGEEKSDAQITSEQANTPQPAQQETPAENTSGSEAADVETDEGDDTAGADSHSEETGGELEGSEWLTDDVKAEAAAFGIDESEIADFASREELDRALRLFDKRALEAGRKALAESEGVSDEGQARNEKGQFEKPKPTKADDSNVQTSVNPDNQFEFKEGVYDEDLESDLKGFRDVLVAQREQYESRLEAMESRLVDAEERFADADALAEEQRFDTAIDSLSMTKLFGTTGSETPAELQKREEVMAQAKVLQAGYLSFGRNVEIETLVNRAAPMVFSSEFDKHKLKQRTRKVSKQANGRQGGGATRPQDPREDPRDEADRKYRELDGV